MKDMNKLGDLHKNTYKIPVRKFCHGEKKLASFRLPEELLRRFAQAAADTQHSQTELLTTVLDQYLQYHFKSHRRS